MYNVAMPPNMNEDGSDLNNPHRMDFILQTETPKPMSFWSKLASPAGLLILSLSLAVIGLFAALAIVLTNQKNNEQAEKLAAITQTQNEIIRIADLAEDQASEESTKKRAREISATVTKSYKNISELLVNRQAGSLESQAITDSETDSMLVEAIRNRTFDETFNELIDDKLFDYQRLLLEVQSGSSDEERAVLETAYTDVDKLLGLYDEANGDSQSDNPASADVPSVTQ